MKLKKYDYKENSPNKNPWELSGLELSSINLIVGRNATGKSRTINTISNLAKIISQRTHRPVDGNWICVFDKYKYLLSLDKGKVLKEEIFNHEKKLLLSRKGDVCKIYSYITDKFVPINPPPDKLVVHIRRDENDFPFLEDIHNWAFGTLGIRFIPDLQLNSLVIPDTFDNLNTLNAASSFFDHLSNDDIASIISNLKKMGYNIEDITIKKYPAPERKEFKILFLKEKFLKYHIIQNEFSNGLYRSICLLIILYNFLRNKQSGTLLIDDIGEGLDYEKETKLLSILQQIFRKEKKFQLIMSTNNQFAMNSIDIKYWNILKRTRGYVVKSKNYVNNKKKFDKFKELGLSNFDLIKYNYLDK